MHRLLLVLAAAALLGPPVAGAATVPRLGTAVPATAVVTDAKHTVAYVPRAGTVAIAHTDGDTVEAPIPAGCVLAGVSGSTVLFGCPPAPPNEGEGPHVPVLYDSDTGERSQPPGLTAGSLFLTGSPDGTIRLAGLGTRWIEEVVSGYDHGPYAYSVFLPRVSLPDPLRPGPEVVTDLDAPDHARALCAPITRTYTEDPSETYSASTIQPLTYAKPWALTVPERGRPRLQRCGQAAARRLSCGACGQIALAGHRLAWRDGTHVVVRDLRRDRTRRLRMPARTPAARLVLTLDGAFVVAQR